MKQYKVVDIAITCGRPFIVTDGTVNYTIDGDLRTVHEYILNLYAKQGWKLVQVHHQGKLLYFERDT